MDKITLQRDGLDEEINSLEIGETVEVYATLKIVSKSDTEIVADVSNVEKCEEMDDSMDSEDESEGPDHESQPGDQAEDLAEGEPHKGMHMKGKGKGKGMGILIMIGGPKKK